MNRYSHWVLIFMIQCSAFLLLNLFISAFQYFPFSCLPLRFYPFPFLDFFRLIYCISLFFITIYSCSIISSNYTLFQYPLNLEILKEFKYAFKIMFVTIQLTFLSVGSKRAEEIALYQLAFTRLCCEINDSYIPVAYNKGLLLIQCTCWLQLCSKIFIAGCRLREQPLCETCWFMINHRMSLKAPAQMWDIHHFCIYSTSHSKSQD